MHQRRHQVAGPRVPIDDVVILAVDAAIDGMNQPVALALLRMHQERRREDPLAAGRENDVDRVIHAAGHHRLEPGAVTPRAKDVGRGRSHPLVPRQLVGLAGEGSLAPIDPTVGTGVGAVQIVCAAGERAGEPLLATIGHAVAVGVGQLPDGGSGGNVERTVQPHRPLGEHHLVGKHGVAIEPAVAVGVLEPQNAMRSLGQLLLDRIVRS